MGGHPFFSVFEVFFVRGIFSFFFSFFFHLSSLPTHPFFLQLLLLFLTFIPLFCSVHLLFLFVVFVPRRSRFVRVQQLQDVFGDGVSLRSPNREVLREGLLWRCKAPPAGSSPDVAGGDAPGPVANGAGAVASSPRPFYFFLLTDLLIIASDGGNSATPYKWKHAFHLSMLRCEDLPPQEQGQHDDTGHDPATATAAHRLRCSEGQAPHLWVSPLPLRFSH